MSGHRISLILACTIVWCSFGCDDPEPGMCGENGEQFSVSDDDYCYYAIIEDGFLCPDDVPYRHDYRDTVVCSGDPDVDAGVFDWVDEQLGGAPDMGPDASNDADMSWDLVPDGSEEDASGTPDLEPDGFVSDGGTPDLELDVFVSDAGTTDSGTITWSGEGVINDDGLACDLALAVAAESVDCSFADLDTDGYVIESAEIVGDIMQVTVSYSGGCQDHDFFLCYDIFDAASDPPTNNVTLVHDAHDDACEAWITEVVEIDLSPLQTSYQAAFGTDEDPVEVVLELGVTPLHEDEINLQYIFSESQGRDECCESLPDALFGINSLEIISDELHVNVWYSGGCEEHELGICLDTNDYWMESFPVQIMVTMSHENNGDMCEAEIIETLVFDLESVRVLYEQSYPGSDGAVILRFTPPIGDEMSILYEW